MSDQDNDLRMDDLMSNRNMLNSTFEALRKRDKSKKIEPWTLDIRDVVDFVPVHKTTIYSWIKVGYFPKHIAKCSNGKYRGKHLWRMAEVLAFLDKCIANDNSYKDHMNELENK